MHLTIDNVNGHGAVDYSAAVVAAEHGSTLTITRTLNRPSRCTAELLLGLTGLPMPQRRARVAVTSSAGAILFTGYVATTPVPGYAGTNTAGAVYTARITAVSDEWLLERPMTPDSTPPLLGARMVPLTVRVAEQISGVSATSPLAGSTTHLFHDGDGTFTPADFSTDAVLELANDITLSGATEPGALVTECFLGDGVTTVFDCSSAFFHHSITTLQQDDFGGDALDPLRWKLTDPGSHISLTSSGLTLSGGTGSDGETTVAAQDLLEMGGSLLLELRGVQLGAASDGVLAGLYEGTSTLPDCFAGFRVRQTVNGTSSTTTLVPVVNGAEAGTSFPALAGHSYTLRLRVHCVEQQRVMQRYTCLADGVVQTFGSAGAVEAPVDLVFELVDEGVASSTPAAVLYDTAATGTSFTGAPAACSFIAVNARQLFGSIGNVRIARFGSAWVESTLPDGTAYTRLIGRPGEGVDCTVLNGGTTEPGKITFLPGRVPVAGERVAVQYRTRQRAVARLQDPASVAVETAGGGSGTSRWLGSIVSPAARSSADCASAAQALLAVATSQGAAVAGTYRVVNPPQDILPGDILALTSSSTTSSLLVRSVEATDGAAMPELLSYRIEVANDHATALAAGLGVTLSEEIAADTTVPETALTTVPQMPANLQQLTVVSLTTTALQLDAGLAAPAGGGFEVRRRDAGFGSSDADLVLRSPVRGLSVPRTGQIESFYVRMYDASTPPLYSRWSSVVITHAPTS